MKALFALGLVLLILGIGSFVIPIPHRENHGVKIGDTSVGVTTQHNEGVPRAVSLILVVAGVAMTIAGARGR
jgi:uncharacterized protein YjeT (DUF2065 family)